MATNIKLSNVYLVLLVFIIAEVLLINNDFYQPKIFLIREQGSIKKYRVYH